MNIEGEFRFDAPRDEVWQSLLDPVVLAQVMPGCEKLELVGESAYEGALKIKVGPVQGKFKGKIKLSEIDAPNGYTLDVDGRGASGFVKANAEVKLSDDEGGTLMTYQSKASIGGKVASVGQRLLDSSAKAIIKQSLDGLNQILQAEFAASSEAEPESEDGTETSSPCQDNPSAPRASKSKASKPPSTYQPPSQAQFAANVAKEVIDDLVPRPVLIGAAVAVVLGLLLLLTRRR